MRPRPNQALIASAETGQAQASRNALRRLDQGWQRETFRCYREIGECWNPAQYYARAMSRIRFFPAMLDEHGQAIEVTSGPLVDLFRRIRPPDAAPGDLAPLAAVYGRLQFLIGDGYLVVSHDQDVGEEVWEYLSPVELRLKPAVGPAGRREYQRVRQQGAPPEELSEAPDDVFEPAGIDQARVWRLWRASPEFTQMADSPVRPLLPLYRLLERLTMAATAEASSRAAQRGMFFVPDEFSFGPVDSSMDENPDEDPLMAELAQAMSRAIRDPDSAEAMAPFLVRAPGVTQTAGGAIPSKDLMGYVPMGPEDRYPEKEMRDAVVRWIATGLDLPTEMLTGMGDLSHWTAWLTQEEGFNSHTSPTLVRFCNDIAAAYLRPAAVQEGVAGAERVVIGYDASQAINHPDKTGTALKAHGQLAVSDRYLRTAIGATEEDAPDKEELTRRVAIQLRQFPSDLAPEPQQGETKPQQGGTGQDASKGTPNREQPVRRSQTRAPAPAGPSMAQMVVGAAVMTLDWARERAGNRLANRARSRDDLRQIVDGVAPPLVASILGREKALGMMNGHGSEHDLVKGTAERFAARLTDWGIDGGWPEQLGDMVEQHALRSLYETSVPPLPPGFLAACTKALEQD